MPYDNNNRFFSYKILSQLKAVFKCNSTTAIFLYEVGGKKETTKKPQVLNWSIRELSPKLTKTLWRKYPAAQFCFAWILHQITSPNLGACIPEFLPFTLCFMDDWEDKNKIMGLTCLDHIGNNSSLIN